MLNFNRREMLKFSSALGVSFLLPALELKAAEERGSKRAKSVITLWMNGGPSQLESWDPHPGTEIGGLTKSIKTTLKGAEIADTYPLMAEQLGNMNLIRSLVSKEGDHERGTYFMKTGFRPDPTVIHPALGAILTRELPDQNLKIPLHISLLGTGFPPRGGYLGDQYDAFRIFTPGNSLQNLQSRVADNRTDRRRSNLEVISKAFTQGREGIVEDTLHMDTIERAKAMMDSPQIKAFDLTDEPASVKAKYGNTSFGLGCLVARRLVELGVRAIEVNLSGFDSHANNFETQNARAKELDPAFATLIQELKERNLFESTVILCMGEFGRTPKINPLEGRDHWPTGFSCVVGGGGLASGVLLGETDPLGKSTEPKDPVKVQDLYATIFNLMGVDFAREQITPIGRPLPYCEGQPLAQLLAQNHR